MMTLKNMTKVVFVLGLGMIALARLNADVDPNTLGNTSELVATDESQNENALPTKVAAADAVTEQLPFDLNTDEDED